MAMKFAEYVVWFESSFLSTVNLQKKIYYSSTDIEFFLGGYFFGAPCISSLIAYQWCIKIFIAINYALEKRWQQKLNEIKYYIFA